MATLAEPRKQKNREANKPGSGDSAEREERKERAKKRESVRGSRVGGIRAAFWLPLFARVPAERVA